jgi:hypothetical protein
MSLTSDPTKLARLVHGAEIERDLRLDALARREAISMGAKNLDPTRGDMSPENLGLAVFQAVIPSMVTSAPVMDCRSSGGYFEQLQVAAIASAGTQICYKQKMQDALRPAAWDMMFKDYACGFIEKSTADMSDLTKAERAAASGRLFDDEPVDVGGEADDEPAPRATATPRVQIPARWPRIKSLDPHRCGFDCKGRTIGEARFTWHEMVEDWEDIMERASEHPDDWIEEGVLDMHTLREDDELREEVNYYVIYVPGAVIEGKTPRPNQPGVIYTIASHGQGGKSPEKGLEIRRPFYWNGHPGGPHIFEGQYVTGKDPFFLGILSGNMDALDMLDSVSMAVRDRMANYKRVYAFDASRVDEATAIAGSKDGEFVAVPGLASGQGIIMPIETGGVTNADGGMLQEVQSNALQQVGIDTSGRGSADPNATATAVSVAANATASKLSYLVGRWDGFVRECLERMAWEIAHDDRIAIRLDEPGREKYLRSQLEPLTQMTDLTAADVEQIVSDQKRHPMFFQGGDFSGDEGFDWNRLDIRIQPRSMEGAQGEQQAQRIIVWAQQLAFLGQQMVTQPHIRWVDIIRDLGRAYGMSDADAVADIDIAQQLAQIQIAQGMGDVNLGSEVDPQGSGATLREGRGGARSPAGVDPGTFQAA